MTKTRADERVVAADRWLEWAALGAVLLLTVAACFRKIWAADFWWQCRTGRYVLEHGWPAVDVFSYTAAGARWIELRWLYCVVQYVVLERLGPGALEGLQWLAVVAAFALVTPTRRRAADFIPAGLVLVVALLAASQRMLVRPELVTFVFFALFFRLLDRHRQSGTRWIWILPLLQVVWVNAHTLFVLGPVLVAVALVTSAGRFARRGGAGARLPALAGVLGTTALACLLNPYTYEGALLPFRLFGEIRGGSAFNLLVEEFQSPFALGLAFTAVRFYVALVVLVVGSGVINARRLDPFLTALVAAQLYLSALAIRNLPLFALAAVPFILANVEASAPFERWPARVRRVVAIAVIAGCAWYTRELVTDRFSLRQHDTNQFGLGLAAHRYPVGAVDFLERARPAGRVLNTMREGSYLLWRDRQVFIDPRLEVYGAERLARYLRVLQDPAAFREAVREFDVRVVLVDLQSNLASLVLGEPDWVLAWFDEVAAVFVRREGASELVDFGRTVERLRKTLPRPRPSTERGPFERVDLPGPYLALTDLLLACGQPDLAAGFLADAVAADPRLPGLGLRRATLRELRGDWRGVIDEARAGLVETPDDPRLQIKLGSAHYQLGQLDEARTWLERSLEARPERARTWGTLGAIHAARGELAEAERSFAKAAELAPRTADWVSNLARTRARLGRTREAIAGLEAALELAPADAGIVRDLALLQASAGDAAAARRYVELGLRLAPGDPALLRLRQQLPID